LASIWYNDGGREGVLLETRYSSREVGSDIGNVVRAIDFDMLVLDGGADGDADDFEGELEVIVDGQADGGVTEKAAPLEDVFDDGIALVLGSRVAGRDGEADDLGGFAGKVDVAQAATTERGRVVRVERLWGDTHAMRS